MRLLVPRGLRADAQAQASRGAKTMTADQLLRLIAAPEIVVVDLVSSAVNGFRLALLAEHPLLDDDLAAPEDPPIRRSARGVLRDADRLRRALRVYRRTVVAVLTKPDGPDSYF